MSAVEASLAGVAGAVGAAALLGGGIVAVDGRVAGGTLGITTTASSSAGIASSTDGLLGFVSAGITAHEAHSGESHHGELVGLRLGGNVRRAGQNGH